MSGQPTTLRAFATSYRAAGWHPIELPPGAKGPPPEGRTGYSGSDMTDDEIAAAAWNGNLGLRMPVDVIGLDVDVYRGGDRTLIELVARCGMLPLTWISHSGRNDGSGIRFFRTPPGLAWVAGLAGLDIIQRSHRYAAAPPSVHPDGRPYDWADQQEARLRVTSRLPEVEDLPELPWPWIAELSRAQPADVGQRSRAVAADELAAFIDSHNQADQPGYIGNILAHFTERWRAGYSRHDTMQHCLIWAMECVRAGLAAARPTLDLLGDQWIEAVSPDTRRAQLASDRRTTEWEAMVRHAVGRVTAKTQDEIHRIHDEVAGPPMRPGPPREKDAYRPVQSNVFIDWRAFADRDNEDRSWLVEGLWPWGRSLALWAGAKTGKSELALWCAAKLALGEHPWTGAPVTPIDVVYLDYEMTEDDLDDRLAEFNINPDRLGRLHYALLPALHALDAETGGAEVQALVTGVGARAVVFDTFGRAVSGDENEADTVRNFYRHTGSRLKRLGIAYLRTDHAGKDKGKGQRGSSAKRDDVDIVWSLERTQTGVVLDCTASSRLSWVPPRLVLDRVEQQGVLSYVSSVRMGWPAGTAAKVAEMDALGLPADISKRNARSALANAGRVPGKNSVLLAALRFRRERKGTTSGTTSSLQAEGPSGDQRGSLDPKRSDQHN